MRALSAPCGFALVVLAPNALSIIAEANIEIVKKMTSALNLLVHIVDSPYSWLTLLIRLIPESKGSKQLAIFAGLITVSARRMPPDFKG
jgi:hypothetical protein